MIRIRDHQFAAGVVVAALVLVSGCSSSKDEGEPSARRSDVDPTISTVSSTSPPTLPPLPTAPLSVTVPPVVSTPPSSRGLLVANRRTWNLERPDRYTYTYAVQCECPTVVAGPFTATVEGESLVSSQVPPEAASGEGAPMVLTIDDLLTLIDDSIGEMARVEVTYDPTLGYPTRILLGEDRVPSATDRTYEVTAFTPG